MINDLLIGVFIGLVLVTTIISTTSQRKKVPLVTNKKSEPREGRGFLGLGIKKSKEVSSGKKEYEGYVLEGIIYDEETPFAIINGKSVKKSERVGDFVVREISRSQVELVNDADDTKLILSLSF